MVGTSALGCHGMNPLAADLGSTRIGDKVARAPYMSQFSYFGYVEPTAKTARQDEAIYFWLPVSTQELGVRFISGPTVNVRPDARHDVQEAAYKEHRKDKARFDPAIEVQRCLTALDEVDVSNACGQWVALGENDDSVEVPTDDQGRHVNSLVRVSTNPDDPLKALGRGLYRVNIQGAKQSAPKGTFVLQLGAPVLLDAVAMARTPEALAQLLASRPHTTAAWGAAPDPSAGDKAPAQSPHKDPGSGAGSLENPDAGTAPPLAPSAPEGA